MKYLIEIDEAYFSQTNPNWNNMTVNERSDIRNAFLGEIESYLLGKTTKPIFQTTYFDENLNLRNAVSLTPIE